MPMVLGGWRRSAVTSPASSTFRRNAPRREKSSNCRFRQARVRRAEHLLEGLPQRDVDVRHGQDMAEIGKTRDAVTRVGAATGHDRVDMRKFRFHIDGYAVERHPALEPHADRGDLA